MVVVAATVAVGVLAAPEVTGDPTLLGRLDDGTGRSSLLPPADGLQRLWRRTVDVLPDEPAPPPPFADLGDGHLLLGGEVVRPGAASLRWDSTAGPLRPTDDGHLVLADGEGVATIDLGTGAVVDRVALRRDGLDGTDRAWSPVGAALGTAAGATILADATGRPGAVETDGTVRWVAPPTWRWAQGGDGTDWAIMTTETGATSQRLLVVDARTGQVHREVGPVGTVHAPVVHGDTLVYVDPYGGIDRGLGAPVDVHGLRLDGSGRTWVARDLPATSGRVVDAVRLTAVDDAVVVDYWTAGHATSATWLDPVTGEATGFVSVGGTGRTPEGWPVTAVLDDALAHVDPVRDEIRVVGNRGRIRWAVPALTGEGLQTDGDVVLVRSPPVGPFPQGRVRALDATTGERVWDRVATSTQDQRIVGVLGGRHVGTAPAGDALVPLRQQQWWDLSTGRRRSGPGLAAAVLGVGEEAAADLTLLGRVAAGQQVVPVLLTAGPTPRVLVPPGADVDPGVLAGPDPPSVAPAASASAAVWDQDLVVTVRPSGVHAADRDGRVLWRVDEVDVALRPDLGVLLGEVVVTVAADGEVTARSRRDGRVAWRRGLRATALTAGGQELVVGTASGAVVVLDRTGSVLQRLDAGSAAVESVAVVEGQVLVAVGADLVAFGRGAAVVEPGERVDVP